MPSALDEFFAIDEHDMCSSRWWCLTPSRRARALGKHTARELVRGTFAGTRTVPFKVLEGRAKSDLMRQTGAGWIASRRFVAVLEGLGCRGYRAHPVVIYDRRDAKVVDDTCAWLRLDVGAQGPSDTSGVFRLTDGSWKQDPTLRGAHGVIFDTSTWTGLDIFTFPRYPKAVMTRRVAEALMTAKLDAVDVVPIGDVGKRLRDGKVERLRKRFGDGAPPGGRDVLTPPPGVTFN